MNLQKLRAQDKIVQTNDNIGNEFIKKQQGTTKTIYDSRALVNSTDPQVIDFFTRRAVDFPFSNFAQNGQLISGDTLALQRISWSVVTVDTNGQIILVQSLDEFLAANPTCSGIATGEFDMTINNNTVMKPISMLHMLPLFNKSANNELTSIFEFNVDVILPPQLDFKLSLKIAGITLPVSENTFYLRPTIEGVGAQLNLKTNM